QIGRPAEVVDREDVRTGLGRRRHDLRRVDLNKAHSVQCGSKAVYGRGGDAYRRPTARMAQGQRAVVEQGRQTRGERGAVQVERRWFGSGEHSDFGVDDLHAGRCCLVGDGSADDLDDAFLRELLEVGPVLWL